MSDALAQSSDGFNQVPAAIDKVYAQVDTDKANAAQSLRDQAADVDSQIERYQQLIEVLESIKPQLDEQYRPAVDAVVSQLNTSISSLGKLRDSLTSAADKMATGNDPESSARADIQAKLDEAKANADKLKNDYENNLKPGLESLASSVAQAAQSLSARASQLSGVGDGLNGAASSVASDLAGAQSAIRAMSDELHGSADKMSALSQRVNEALASGNVEQLKQVIGSDPEALAKAVSAPVGVERIAVFPVEDFGSAMAPLYTTLALWVGSLLIMVLLNPVPSERAKREAGLVEPKSWQLFFGRYGAPFVLAFMQSTVVCLGNMLFVGVQVANPLLYLLCFWTAGFVFSFIIYTLVSLFANLGKALAVLLLIIYVTGGGGEIEGGRLADGCRKGWSLRARSGFGPRPFHVCACVRPRWAVRLALREGSDRGSAARPRAAWSIIMSRFNTVRYLLERRQRNGWVRKQGAKGQALRIRRSSAGFKPARRGAAGRF